MTTNDSKETPAIKPADHHHVALSENLRELREEAHRTSMTVGGILDFLSVRGHALLLLFFSAPLLLPVGIPVLTTILGPILTLLAGCLLFGKHPWLPRRIREHAVSGETVEKMVRHILPWEERMEKHLHPRLLRLSEEGPALRFHAAYMLLLALVVSIPLPVLFANLVAALPIALLSLGLIKRDGFVIIAAYVAVIPCVSMYSGLAFLGIEGIERLIGWIK